MAAAASSLAPARAPVPPAVLEAFVREALERVGLSAADAATVAEPLVLADTMGVFTHGTKLLRGYLRKLVAGGYRPAGRPRVLREGPAWAIVDGDAALGQVGSAAAIRLAIAKARACGTAYVGLVNTGHIGAAGSWALAAAREGLLGMAMGNDVPSVAAPGSRTAVLGSNPLAWAAPLPGSDPIFLDIATSAVAGGKVYAAVQRGGTIPPGWLVGPDGLPTVDGSLYPASAALAPMAGHKGYGIALLVELLSAVMAGGAAASQVGSWIFDPPAVPSRHNAAFVAIDIAAVAGPGYAARLRALVDEIHAADPAPGVERVLLPGEIEWRNRAVALERGIMLPDDVRAVLAEAAEIAGVSPPQGLANGRD
jgi:ureidoglycolate dehydrogenase (NAD+)